MILSRNAALGGIFFLLKKNWLENLSFKDFLKKVKAKVLGDWDLGETNWSDNLFEIGLRRCRRLYP